MANGHRRTRIAGILVAASVLGAALGFVTTPTATRNAEREIDTAPPEQALSPTERPRHDADRFLQGLRSLRFGNREGVIEGEVESGTPTLRGIVMSPEPIALVSFDGKGVTRAKVGSVLADGTTLINVSRKSVTVRRADGCETIIAIHGPLGGAADETSPPCGDEITEDPDDDE